VGSIPASVYTEDTRLQSRRCTAVRDLCHFSVEALYQGSSGELLLKNSPSFAETSRFDFQTPSVLHGAYQTDDFRLGGDVHTYGTGHMFETTWSSVIVLFTLAKFWHISGHKNNAVS